MRSPFGSRGIHKILVKFLDLSAVLYIGTLGSKESRSWLRKKMFNKNEASKSVQSNTTSFFILIDLIAAKRAKI